MHVKADVLTYNEITDNPAETLAVAVSFSENRPAHVCGLWRSLENKTTPHGRRSERGLTTAITGGSNG
jgi:hypothetical protein